MVLVQNWPFFHLFFQAIQARKMCFIIFQKDKTLFQGIKTRSLKSRKLDIFPNGVVHGFGQKLAIFSPFLLGNIGLKNVFYDILEEKTPLQGIKKRSSKSRKIDIFSKGLVHDFGPKLAIVPPLCLGNIGLENVFYNILEG